MRKVFLILLITLLTAGLSANDGEWITFKGKVVDAKTQEALIGAKITFGENIYVVYSDPDGNFEIDIPTDIAYEISVELISYRPSVFNVSSFSSENRFELSSWEQ